MLCFYMSRKPTSRILSPAGKRQLMREGAALSGMDVCSAKPPGNSGQEYAAIFEESPLLWRSEFDAIMDEVRDDLLLAQKARKRFGGPNGYFDEVSRTSMFSKKPLVFRDENERKAYLDWFESKDSEICEKARYVLGGSDYLLEQLKYVEWSVRNHMEVNISCNYDNPDFRFSPLDFFHRECREQLAGDQTGLGSLSRFRWHAKALRDQIGPEEAEKLLGKSDKRSIV